MMVYFMPYYKSIKSLQTIILTLLIAFAPIAVAASSAIHIKSAELLAAEDSYALSTDFDIVLSPAIEDALNKGVPLTFLIEFQLSAPRKYLFILSIPYLIYGFVFESSMYSATFL